MNRRDREKPPPDTDGWLSKGAIAAVAAAAGAALALWATSPSEEEKTQQRTRQTQPTRGLQTAPGTRTTYQTAPNHVQRPVYQAPTATTFDVVVVVVVPTNLILQIGEEKHKQNLQRARNLPGITEITGHSQDYSQKTYLVTGLSEAAVADAVRTIELRVVRVTVRFPGNLFQGSPEFRQSTLRQHVQSSPVVLTFSGDTQSTDVLIGVEGVTSNVEQATATLLRIKSDFNYAEDIRRHEMAQRAHQQSNASEGVAVVGAKASAPSQAMSDECIICVDIPANTAFIPCGHKTFCEPCAQQIFQGKGECPTCRGRITSVLRLYG
ncbi:hypothetical protein BV898_06246 [Hypsibius exemplaris]|uniref:RING-type domain-containing protein n=1 Tax=Hypsibius exemplaris TaxID=2072580 RepID=A0A1W0WWZ6_HYPEX|nr:hypothetical protein BV898_06246 [Hypsibius exemplaris]